MKISLTFEDFWNGFDPRQNLFKAVLEKRLGYEVEICESSKKADLIFRSVFPYKDLPTRTLNFALSKWSERREKKYTAATKYGSLTKKYDSGKRIVWFSGENIPHTPGTANLYLGFDQTDLKNGVLYFPYWMYRLNWSLGLPSEKLMLSPSELVLPRMKETKSNKVCMFSSMLEPRRLRLLELTQKVFEVDKYGRAFDKFVEDKKDISLLYGMQICPENSISPGYVTEKVLEAWGCGNVPIWEGIDRDFWINQDAIINLTNKNSEEIVQILSTLDSNQLQEMRSRPILNREPSLNLLVNVLGDLLS